MDLGDLISAVGMWTSKTPAIGLPACSRRLYGVRLGYTLAWRQGRGAKASE